MIKFNVSLDASLKNSIGENVKEHLAKTLTDWSAGKLAISDLVMVSADSAYPYIYYYRHIPSGDIYCHNFVTSEWVVVKNQLPL